MQRPAQQDDVPQDGAPQGDAPQGDAPQHADVGADGSRLLASLRARFGLREVCDPSARFGLWEQVDLWGVADQPREQADL